ncbi:MAG: hypothetical protein V4539_08660 [Bacteroidota bacterium]
MKKKIVLVCLSLIGFFSSGNAQVLELITFVTNKVVKAIDLKVQAMQNATINLQLIQQEAENELSKHSLGEIGTLTEKQKELYASYYASLKQVKVVVGASAQVLKVRQQQKALNELYNSALSKTRLDSHFTAKERVQIQQTYKTIIDEGATTLDKLETSLRNNTISATDADRMKLITQSANQLDGLLYKLQTLYERNQQISIKRARDKEEALAVRSLYGLGH